MCQYTPGSGGKTLLTLMQLCEKIHSWYDKLDTDFEKFVEEKITKDSSILKNFFRNLIFT